MRERGPQRGRASRRAERGAPLLRHAALLLLIVPALVASGCGGGGDRQDKDEPKGNFEVEVVRATFPDKQKLARRSELEIVLRNADRRRVPNIAVTVKGFEKRKNDPDLADPSRPQFVINGRFEDFGGIRDAEERAPEGGTTAYVSTWALGPLRPGETKTFKWDVTAVTAGPYKISYEVAAGLDGKARAVDDTGQMPRGEFAGTVDAKAPKARIASDGKTVVTED